MDKICIEDLEIYARHGVYPEENKLGQKFLICAQLFVDARKAARQDDLQLSVNYGEVCYYLKELMEQHTFRLIETAADFLAQEILLKFPIGAACGVGIKEAQCAYYAAIFLCICGSRTAMAYRLCGRGQQYGQPGSCTSAQPCSCWTSSGIVS